MYEEGPRYHYAAKAAAEWLNLHNPDQHKAEQFSRLLYLILSAMYEAERELRELREIISRN